MVHLLLVDNTLERRIQIKQILERLPVRPHEATTGAEATELVCEYDFAVIILNTRLPDMSGFHCAKEIRSQVGDKMPPVIFISPKPRDAEQLSNAYRSGGTDFIEWTELSQVLYPKVAFYAKHHAQKVALEEANRTKSEFLSNMSHELRTPLNSILVLAQLLGDNPENNLTEKQLRFSRTIYSSGTDLLNLINEILDLSKIESGVMEFVTDEIILEEFVADIAAKLEHTALTKGLGFDITYNRGLPRRVFMDGVRVHQIINNLLSNAIKFTQQGSVKLTVERPKSPLPGLTPNQCIAISVADTGIGIPPDQQLRIFEAFRQADGSIRRKFGGTGLGLSISKKLAERMGGRLTLESEEHRGSTFTLMMPVSPAEMAKASVVPSKTQLHSSPSISQDLSVIRDSIPPTLISALNEKRLLVAEDDIVNVYVMLALLEKLHNQPIVVSNGEEVLETLESGEPVDLVLMDMMMPKMDGFETTRRIKANEQFAHIPVIAVTARAMAGDKEKCTQAGVDGYVTKPVLANDLFSEIGRCLGQPGP